LTRIALLTTRDEEEQGGQPAFVQKVIDKRGPQERVLTDLRGLNDEHEIESNDVPMPELQYNVRLLVDDAKVDVQRLHGQLRREREKAASLAREQEKLSKQEAVQKRQLQVMETIAGALEKVRVDDAAGILTLEGLFMAIRDLKARFEEEFKMCGVAWIACQFAHPLLIRFFQGWQPLQDPSVGLEVMSSWKDLLEEDQPYDFSHGAASMAPYAQLVSELILPPVRIQGTNSWDARVPEPMLDLLRAWEQVLPPVALGLILEHVVKPKLSAAVESWDPRRENVPIHVWVHPWLPMLEQRSIETLCSSIRYKLSSVLHVWQARDASAHALLSPWQNVFDSAVWEDLTARYIVPKLKMALQEFQINPADQNLDQFNWVMLCASTIPVQQMVHMLEVDFFSKWHQAMYHWLCSPNPNFNEIVSWYKGWKGLFPPELLANERIRMLLALGLDMMNQAAEGLEVVQPGTKENPGYLRGTEKRPLDAARLPSCHGVLGTAMADLSFKECVQAYAMEKGLLFMPRVGKSYNGLPVYEFGTVSICLDSVKRVVYAQLREGAERWSAASLRQVVEMN
jgi:tuftelin-interacting protein 11